MTPIDELKALAKILADWASPAPAATIYLFGSRVRGDHRPDSDVDISIKFAATDAEVHWWTNNNQEFFATIDARLPGKLAFLEQTDPLNAKIQAAPVVYRDRNVVAVWMAPKP